MRVHIRAGIGDLRLTLSNGDEVLDTQLAATPQEANRIGIMMLASRDAFDRRHPDLPARRRGQIRNRTAETGRWPMKPTSPNRLAAALPAVQAAHTTLIGALANLKPNRIVSSVAADRFDIMQRADHLDAILSAVTTYVKAVVADTAYLAPIGYVADETGYLVDAASEITGALNSAVDRMIDDADEANPGAWLRARQAEVAR
jgi:hypothetical protein